MMFGPGARVEVAISASAARRWPREVSDRLNGSAGEVVFRPATFWGISDDWREVRFDFPVRLAMGGEKYVKLTLRAADLKELP